MFRSKFSYSNSKSSYSDLLEDIESGNIESIFFYPRQREINVLYKNGDKIKIPILYNDQLIIEKATENKVAMTIDERQFVGIGTNDPKDKLHLSGNARIETGGLLFSQIRDDLGQDERINITSGAINNEINGNGGVGAVDNDSDGSGFLRLSGGGLLSEKSYIDLYGANSNRITFGTKGLEQMVLDRRGQLGIGTTTPNSKLDIADPSNDNIIFIRRGSLSNQSGIQFAQHDGNNYGPLIVFDSNQSSEYGIDSLQILSPGHPTGEPLEREAINVSWNGKVRLGTSSNTTDGEKLGVNGNVRISGHTIIEPGDNTQNFGTKMIDVVRGYDGWNPVSIEQTHTENYGGNIIFNTKLADNDNSTPPLTRMTILNDGNIGINTTSPTKKLDVRGNVRIGNGQSVEQDIEFISNAGNWQVGTNNSGNNTTDNNQFYVFDTNSSKYSLTVQKTSGHVGIGKANPDYKLDVDGGSRFLTEGNTTGVISKRFNVATVMGNSGDGGNRGKIQVWSDANNKIALFWNHCPTSIPLLRNILAKKNISLAASIFIFFILCCCVPEVSHIIRRYVIIIFCSPQASMCFR